MDQKAANHLLDVLAGVLNIDIEAEMKKPYNQVGGYLLQAQSGVKASLQALMITKEDSLTDEQWEQSAAILKQVLDKLGEHANFMKNTLLNRLDKSKTELSEN